MRMAELAARSGVPVATVKYYLRERLLHEGELTSPTQARYDDSHLARLRLVRALLGPGRLSVATTRDVLRAIEQPPDGTYDLLGVAATAVGPGSGPRACEPEDHPRVHALLRHWGWPVEEQDWAGHDALARALDALDDAGFEPPPGILDTYAQAMTAVGEAEIAGVPTGSAAAAVRYVVLGTVLVEPVLLAMRRLAQQAAAARRFAGAAPDDGRLGP